MITVGPSRHMLGKRCPRRPRAPALGASAGPCAVLVRGGSKLECEEVLSAIWLGRGGGARTPTPGGHH
jgi:hypothetical protein